MVAADTPMDRTNPDRSKALRGIPSVDAFLRSESYSGQPRPLVVREARRFLDDLRTAVLRGDLDAVTVLERVEAGPLTVLEQCLAARRRHHSRVINATGIVLHTGIGRAPLAASARRAVEAAAGYSIVEVDPRSGARNQREEAVAGLLADLCGAEGALVVNNNAAMVNLVLQALGDGGEVVVSRGELVEIGGGFRMPDVMAAAGSQMVEVGATNRTHLSDYETAITDATTMLLKVHPSNYRILGFHSMPTLRDLVELGKRRDVLVFEDLGSGLLVREPLVGLETEPCVQDSVEAGVPLTCFSGDKLLGGPQCGILVGDRELVARVRAHPLYRAFRCDKLTLAGLEATLQIYRDGDPMTEIPTIHAISRPVQELEAAATSLAAKLSPWKATVVSSESYAGSGANPAKPMPSFAVAIPGGDALADRLRNAGEVAVFARIDEDHVLLDLRTLILEDPDEVADLLIAALSD